MHNQMKLHNTSHKNQSALKQKVQQDENPTEENLRQNLEDSHYVRRISEQD